MNATKRKIVDTITSGEPLFYEFPEVVKGSMGGLEIEFGVNQKGTEEKPEPDIDETQVHQLLENGGRIYKDCGHVEGNTLEAECPLRLTVAYEALKEICWNKKLSPWLDNHSCDWKGNTFGGIHENYARRAPRRLWRNLVPYFVARILFDGAGWVDRENRYQLSQRADFMNDALGGDTPTRRSIITSRDEPFMETQAGHRRMHVICGDPHMCPVDTFLKIGMTEMMGMLLDEGVFPEISYNVDCAVSDMQRLSRSVAEWDPAKAESQWFLQGIKSGSKSALDLLERLLSVADAHFSGADPVADAVLALGRDTLEKLGRNPWELRGRLDWVTKLELLNTFYNSHPDDEWLRSQDIEYHVIGKRYKSGEEERGLYNFLVEKGSIEQLFSSGLLKQAILEPSPHTRSFFRGRVVQMVKKEFEYEWKLNYQDSLCWERIVFTPLTKNGREFTVHITDPFRTYEEHLPRVRKMLRGEEPIVDF